MMSSDICVLIYCPDVAGHRHLYVKRTVRFLAERKIPYFVAYAGRLSRVIGPHHFVYDECDLSYLVSDFFSGHELIDIRGRLNRGDNECVVIDELLQETHANRVLFIDGDLHKWTILRLASRCREEIRLFCIHLHTDYAHLVSKEVYLRSRSFFGQAVRAAGRTLLRHPSTVGRSDCVLFPARTGDCWRRILNKPSVGGVFCMDKTLEKTMPSDCWIHVEEFGHLGLDDKIASDDNEGVEWSRLLGSLEAFLDGHRDKRVILSIGDLEPRKGFDMLLRFVAATPDTVCVRIGRTKPGYTPTWEAVEAKESLLIEGRLFELDLYVRDERLFERAYDAAEFMILPYQDFYRTSGIFVDALWRGKPVLGPDCGIMGQRIEEYGLGMTFDVSDLASLQAVFPLFADGLQGFKRAIDDYRVLLNRDTFDAKLSCIIE